MPPVQPTAMTNWLLPSLMYCGTRKSSISSSRRVNSFVTGHFAMYSATSGTAPLLWRIDSM